MDRKQFMVTAFRYLLLSGILLVSGKLIKDRYDHPDACKDPGFCKTCNWLDDCTLPQALNVKDDGEK